MRQWTGEDNAELVRRGLRELHARLAAEQREREQQEQGEAIR
jgi:Arc/MetJ-type ribon-helix-helix transcriptional regulator